MNRVIVDAGPLVALLNAADKKAHEALLIDTDVAGGCLPGTYASSDRHLAR
jgi:hypothetical protein